jgi:hypothetical protein
MEFIRTLFTPFERWLYFCLQVIGCHYSHGVFYFKMSDGGWDQIQDLQNNRLAH